MYINKYFDNIKIICLNLKHRRDRKLYMMKQCKRRGIDIKFHTATIHKNPKRGCLESHLNIIKRAYEDGEKYILILEDDVKFLKHIKDIPKPPDNWDMLYLGGTVKENISQYDKNWFKVSCFTTHAYILNLQNKELIEDIFKAASQDKEIDSYYIFNIHYKYNVYISNPMMAIQREDYSDIEGKRVNYDNMEDSLNGFNKPDFEVDKDNNYILKLPQINDEDLPYVSIVTPTYNRRKIFSIAINNFCNFIYPHDKLEWIIIDDSEKDEDSVEDLINISDNRINYIRLKDKHYSISNKRNIGANKAKYEYIVHMDDDDYYPSESILSRIKVLLKYPHIGCVGCSTIGSYNILNNTSTLSSDGDQSLSEASMAYSKKFWELQAFDSKEYIGEYKSFIQGRFTQIMDIPYSFVLIAISHKLNYTDQSRKIIQNNLVDNTGKIINLIDTINEEDQLFISDLRKLLLK